MKEEIERAIEECLKEHEEEHPNGHLFWGELRKRVAVKTGNLELGMKEFGTVLNELMRQQKVVSFGAPKMGLIILRLNEP